jgi:hypothetical protein
MLPLGLTLEPNGQLHGKPTAAGSFNFTVTATDANNCTGSRAYTLTIVKPAPVGGYLVLVSRVELLAPWLGLAAVALAASPPAAPIVPTASTWRSLPGYRAASSIAPRRC